MPLLFRLIVYLLLFFAAAPSQAQQCIDYWTVGPSNCEPTPPPSPPPAPALPAPVAAPPVADPLEQRIQEFYQTYDKPPRAFVEFTLNPTPANALKWVKEYEAILNRTNTSAEAWTTAQRWYEDYQRTGRLPADASAALSREEQAQLQRILAASPAGPALAAPLVQSRPTPELRPSRTTTPPAPPTITAGASSRGADQLNRGSRRVSAAAPEALPPQRPLINYYFSAQCQFCKRFGPELATVLEAWPDRFDVSCVDMTPGEKTAANKPEYLNCAYRPLNPGEAQLLGVRVTPTLLIDARDGRAPDLIPGYQPQAQLQAYLQQRFAGR